MPDPSWIAIASSQHPPLTEGEIHIWRINLDAVTDPPSTNSPLLSQDERERAERLKIPLVKMRFMAGRIELRRILARYLDIPPQAVQLQPGPHGKPEIGNPGDHRLQFNLTHSDSLGLLAVRLTYPIGIDLEQVRPLSQSNLEYIAHTAFTLTERDALAKLSGDAYLHAFFRCWTCKEAVMKAHGVGFRLAQSFSVTLGDTPSVTDANETIGSDWELFDLPMEHPFVATVATAQSHISFKFRLFNPTDTPLQN